MELYEREFTIPITDSITHLERSIKQKLKDGETPIRVAVTATTPKGYHVELGIMKDLPRGVKKPESIFAFEPRKGESVEKFNAVLAVPTGIGAEIGGHAGDAGPVAKLLSSLCDTLITHPNVVNASDINELPEKDLYVEGSNLCRLLMGTIGLEPVRANRILFVIDKHKIPSFSDASINALNAARATYGLNCPRIVQLNPSAKLKAQYTPSGRAAGHVSHMAHLINTLNKHRDEYDAVALASVIEVPQSFHADYFKSDGKMVNPWGGVEAIFTHSLSMLYNVPTAHSPMLESEEVEETESGVIDPRMAAEDVSYTFLQCILKGLLRSPRIVTDRTAMQYSGVITARNVSCLIIPNGCIGLPTLAALEQGIPVIAVKENKNLMQNDLTTLPWRPGQFHLVENYLEAAGVMCALKAGITTESVRRPLYAVTPQVFDAVPANLAVCG